MKSFLYIAIPLIVLLAGCSQTPLPERTIAPQDIIGYHALLQLNGLSPGQAARLSASPWGDNVDVILLQKYRSATGFDCMRLQLAGRTALACQTADNLWVAGQAFTR